MEHFEEHEEVFPIPTSYVVAGYAVMVVLAIAIGSLAGVLFYALTT